MFSLKSTLICAAIGFVTSFLSGLIGGVSFGTVFVRAILFAAVGAILGSTCYMLYQKYLSDEYDTMEPQKISKKDIPVGSVVDINIEDDTLPDDASAPDFAVRKGDQEATESTSSQKEPKETVTLSNNTFQPKESIPPQQFQGLSLDKVTTSNTVDETSVDSVNVIEDLDELPDIDNLVPKFSASGSEIIEDSSFAQNGTSLPPKTVEFSKETDAKELAEAIRTVLHKDG